MEDERPWAMAVATDGVGRWSRRLLQVALLVVVIAADVKAICPSKCICDDDLLLASCIDAGLEVVPIQLNPELKAINLQENKIVNVQFTLGIYTNLRNLDVSRNKITTLGSKNFELQNKLLSLNLSNNLVSNLRKDTFKGLKSLRVLDLSENQLETLEGGAFLHLNSLIELYVTNNKILDIGTSVFDKLHNLVILQLGDNQLLDVPTPSLRALVLLQQLDLSGNLIANITDDSAPMLNQLTSLSLASNVISNIDRSAFDGLPALEYLDLSDNNLTSTPTESLSKLNNLTDLDLSGNGFLQMLKPVAFQSLFELRRVKLSRLARLWKIDVRTFVDNIKLESIEMDNNPVLDNLPWRLFHGNPLLVSVSVRGNGFTTLDASHFPLDQLDTLSLGGNPLHCNCSLLWLWLLAQQQAEYTERNETSLDVTPVLDVENIRCWRPDVARHTLIVSVPESEVRCDASWLAVIIVTAVVFALFVVTCVVLLVVGNGRCKKEEKRNEVIDNQQRLHQNGAVLMLLSQQDSLDNFVLRTNKELMNGEQQFQPLAPWDPRSMDSGNCHQDPRLSLYHGQYSLNGTIKKPKHVVYV